MKKDHIEVPKPSSKFQKVNCEECGELQIVYSHASPQLLHVIHVVIQFQSQQVLKPK